MNEAHFSEALCSELYAFDDEALPATAFPLSYAFLGKAQSTDVGCNPQARQNHLTLSNPSQGEGKQENSFATTAKLWSQRNYKKESSNAGTTITLDIPVSIEPKKPLVNTSGGLE